MFAMSKPLITIALLSCLALGMLFALSNVSEAPGVGTEQALRGSANNEFASMPLVEEAAAPVPRQRRLVELQPAALTAEVEEEKLADEIVEAAEPIEDELVENEPVADEMVVEDELVEGEKAERNLVKAGAAEVEDKKENAVLSWSEQVGETKGFWGPDNQERAQLAQFVTKGTWDRLVEDDEESFSFSFDL